MIIAWDVDDVLNDFTSSWIEWAGSQEPVNRGRYLDPGDWLCHNGWTHDLYLQSIDGFRQEAYQHLAPNAAVIDWLASDHSRATHVALTRTPLRFAPVVSSWVMRFFGTWFRGVLVTPSRRPGDPIGMPYPSKGAVLAELGGPCVLVDDSLCNLAHLPAGIHGVLFPRPWNSPEADDDFHTALRGVTSLVFASRQMKGKGLI